MPDFDAVIIGSGPNGLTAACVLARAGWSVLVLEARDTIGGGTRTAELTLPGFRHDICSAIHPLGLASPILRELPLHDYGLEYLQPDYPLAHPFDDGTAAVLEFPAEHMGSTLGRDADAYRRLFGPFVRQWQPLMREILGPLHIPSHPLLLARFGIQAIRSARGLAEAWFAGRNARGLVAGIAAHSLMPLERLPTASFALVLGALAHAVGWPIPRGGSQSIANALTGHLRSLGGQIETNARVTSLADIPPARAILFDLTPRQILDIAGSRFPERYCQQLRRYRYGPGVFKLDLAVSAPIPWTAEAPRRAGTVHLGGTLEEIAHSERLMWEGRIAEQPYVLVAQPSLFDETRAPEGKHTVWAYCHVPHDSNVDMSERIIGQIERFAPGFRDTILARHSFTASELESYNPNYVGGDINGGVQDIFQLFTRPVARLVPYATPARGLYICSASTPPGGGVHGMCGYHAARAVLRQMT